MQRHWATCKKTAFQEILLTTLMVCSKAFIGMLPLHRIETLSKTQGMNSDKSYR
jgi:hypothetical protein